MNGGEGVRRLLTVAEAAEALRLDPSQVRRMAAEGRLPCYCLPSAGARNHYRFDLDEILEATRIRAALPVRPGRSMRQAA